MDKQSKFIKISASLLAAMMLMPAPAALAATWTDMTPSIVREDKSLAKFEEALKNLGRRVPGSAVSIEKFADAAQSQGSKQAANVTLEKMASGSMIHKFSSGFAWEIPAPATYTVPSGFSANPADLAYGYEMPYVIGVDVTNQVVSVVALGENGQYDRLIRQFICSTGLDNSPTPIGIHYLSEGERNDWAYFKTYKCYVRYPVRIYGNYFFHSLLYSKKDVSSLKTTSYKNIGSKASHGCIRMLDEEVQWVSANCHEGTAVVIFEGTANEALNTSLKP